MANLINPAPATPVGIILVGGTKQITINWTPCDEIDYAGTIIQISTSAGGTYTVAGEVTGSTATISGLSQSTQYFVKLAHYDKFGKTGLNWSAPVSTYTDNFNSLVDARIGSAIINGGQILGNTVPSSALSTEALYAPLAVIGDTQNLIRNGIGDRGTAGWLVGSPTVISPFAWSAFTSQYSGTACLTFDDRDHLYGDKIPVKVGDEFWASMWCIPRGGGTMNYDSGIGFIGYAADGVTQTEYKVVTRPAAQLGAQLLAGSVAVTNSATCTIWPWVWINKTAGTTNNGTTGNGIHATQIQLQRRNKGELIVDGTITGSKILTNSITADKIDTRSLTIKDAAGNVIFGSGTNIDFSRVNASSGWLNSQVYANPSSNWLNSNITVNASGYLTGAGSTVQVANSALPTGTNLVYNPDFSNGAGIDGWQWWGINGIATSNVTWGKNLSTSWYLSPWTGKGTDVAFLEQLNIQGNQNYYIELSSLPIPVAPNTRYISSGYTGAHRCKVAVFAYFYDATGAITGVSYNGTTNENISESSGGQAIGGYKRVYGYYDTPINAAYARVILRKYDTTTGQANSYMFATKIQLEAVGSTCVVPGPWTDSGIMDPTSIRAVNPINSANVSTYIAAAAIGYAQMGYASIGTANIQNAAVKSAQIEDLAVTTGKIANLSVDTLQIAGRAVTLPNAAISTSWLQGTYYGTIPAQDHYGGWGWAVANQPLLVTLTYTSSGGSTVLMCSAGTMVGANSGYGIYSKLRLVRNGTTIATGYWGNNNDGITGVLNCQDTPPAGVVTYQLYIDLWKNNQNAIIFSAGSPKYGDNATIIALECKR